MLSPRMLFIAKHHLISWMQGLGWSLEVARSLSRQAQGQSDGTYCSVRSRRSRLAAAVEQTILVHGRIWRHGVWVRVWEEEGVD